MANVHELIQRIQDGRYDQTFGKLYAGDKARIETQRQRYIQALKDFAGLFGEERQVVLYSTPGRTEIGGNHTDHNNGLVMAAAVDLDIIGVVSKNDDRIIRVISKGFKKVDSVPLDELSPCEKDRGHSAALIRGVADGILRRGGRIGGLDIYTTSDVLRGSGLSSSAAFEVEIGAALRGEYNDGDETLLSQAELAKIGQYAENVHFGKPCGLMDQMACAMGGLIVIDFKEPQKPQVEKLRLDLQEKGFALCISDTGGSHSDLTGDYAAIRAEMEAVAACFGCRTLRELNEERFFAQLGRLREKTGDRPLLRAAHFFAECDRVRALRQAVQQERFDEFLSLILQCGHSSFEYNQNAYSAGKMQEQGIPLALAVSQRVLQGQGAWRLQGGGFAGTVQAFVPLPLLRRYRSEMEAVFGKDTCKVLNIRAAGAIAVTEDMR